MEKTQLDLNSNLNAVYDDTNENYNIVKQERDSLISKKNTIFLPEHLYIVSFKSNLGSEYMLLYKNFLSREKAYEHCNKFAYFLDNKIII